MGGNFRLSNGLNKLCRVWPTRPRSKKAHKLVLSWCFLGFSKSVVISRKMHLLYLCKNSVSTDISTFLVFISRVDHLVTIHTKIWMKIAFKKLFLEKIFFFYLSPQNYATQQKYFKIPLTWRLRTCKWFLIKCILMLSCLDQKMQFEKWTVITFVHCTCI